MLTLYSGDDDVGSSNRSDEDGGGNSLHLFHHFCKSVKSFCVFFYGKLWKKYEGCLKDTTIWFGCMQWI